MNVLNALHLVRSTAARSAAGGALRRRHPPAGAALRWLATQEAAPPPAAAPPARRARRAVPSPLTISDSAAERMADLLGAKPDKSAVRVGVKRRGCNGLSYTMAYVDTPDKLDDVVTHADTGIKVYIEPAALFHIVGTTMDFVEDELRAEFVFTNPNSKGECGCGESFRT